MSESGARDMEDENDFLLLSPEPQHQMQGSRGHSRKDRELTTRDDGVILEVTLPQESADENKQPEDDNDETRGDNEDSIDLVSEETSQVAEAIDDNENYSERNIYNNTRVSSMASTKPMIIKEGGDQEQQENSKEYQSDQRDYSNDPDKLEEQARVSFEDNKRENKPTSSNADDALAKESSDDEVSHQERHQKRHQQIKLDGDADVSNEQQKPEAEKEEEDADAIEERKRNEFMEWRRTGVPEFIYFEFGKDDCTTDDEKPKPRPPPKKHRIQKAPSTKTPVRRRAPSATGSVADHSQRSSAELTKEEPARYYKGYKIRQTPRKTRSSSQDRLQPQSPPPTQRRSPSYSPTQLKERRKIIAEKEKKKKKSHQKLTKMMRVGLKKAKSDIKELKAMISGPSSTKHSTDDTAQFHTSSNSLHSAPMNGQLPKRTRAQPASSKHRFSLPGRGSSDGDVGIPSPSRNGRSLRQVHRGQARAGERSTPRDSSISPIRQTAPAQRQRKASSKSPLQAQYRRRHGNL
jgi:hypothetical protein